MIVLLTMMTLLEGVSPVHAAALTTVINELRRDGSGEAYIKAQATGDLNDDGLIDGVFVFSYKMGPGRDHRHTEYLSVVTSTASGYTASWPVSVGARGFRSIREIEIEGKEVTLRGNFTVSDGTASMATLPAFGEIHLLFVDGKLQEQGGWWTRRPGL